MKIFVSSLIHGLGAYRDAVSRAARTFRHEVKRSEDFPASPDSPQRVCLAGVREADVTVLILGAAYGEPQGAQQLSATHEEYREARERGDVLVFIQEGVTPELRQQAFVDEVQSWSRGHYTASFSTPEELQDAATWALHELEVSRKTGAVNEPELLERATALLPNARSSSSASLCVVLAGAPRHQVVRPAELESTALREAILQAALFSGDRVLDTTQGTRSEIAEHHLVIQQDLASVLLTELGDIRIIQSTQPDRARRTSYLPVLIEEEVHEGIARALRFAAWVLDHVDPNRRLGSVAPIAAVIGGEYLGWLTRDERDASPRSVPMGTGHTELPVATLTPVSRPRPAVGPQALAMAEDLTIRLKRSRR